MSKIYFAQCLGRIKIGIARNVKARLWSLRTGAGAPVVLIASVAGNHSMEKSLHRKLRAYRIDGEWYRDCSEVRAAIQNSLNNFPAAGILRPDGRGGTRKFGAVAKIIWPSKTAAHIAAVGGISERHAARIIAGEFEAPGLLLAAVIVEITRRSG